MSRVGTHVYVKDALKAVEVYKEAFKLEAVGEPWLDDEGVLIHQDLQLGGKHFMGVTDELHHGEEMKEFLGGTRLTMLNTVYFVKPKDLRKTFELLYKEGNPSTGLAWGNGEDVISCDVTFVDRFGVFWYFGVPNDWNVPFIP